MKGFKKLLTVILAVVMVMATSVTAFATEAETTGTVTVEKAVPGQQYDLYKIFTFEKGSDANTGVYKVTNEWKKFFTEGEGAKYITVDANGYATWTGEDVDNTNTRELVLGANVGGAQEFAQAALDYAKKNVKAVASQTAPKAAEGETTSKVTFAGLPYAYYLVGSSTGALVGLNTLTGSDVTIFEKNDVPTVDKEVKEDSGDYQKQNDAEIGQVVEYRTTIHAKAHGTGYKLYDVMDAGLSFNKTSVKVQVAGKDVDAKNWKLEEGGAYSESENATFTITFDNAYTEALEKDTDIVVTYTATITSEAQKNVGLQNKTVIEYGNKSRSEDSITKTYVWGIKIVKYTGDIKNVLADAKFVIFKSVEGGIVYAVAPEGKITGWTAVDDTKAKLSDLQLSYFEEKGATVFTSAADGTIFVEGFDADSYSLLEVVAPQGYNKLTAPINFTIESNVTANGKDIKDPVTLINEKKEAISVKEIDVENNSGSLLPSTGGIGTTIFYIVGGLLIAAGVAYFILRRKAEVE